MLPIIHRHLRSTRNSQHTCTTGLTALAGKAVITLAHKKGIHELLRINVRTQMWLNLAVTMPHLQKTVAVLSGRLGQRAMGKLCSGKDVLLPHRPYGAFGTSQGWARLLQVIWWGSRTSSVDGFFSVIWQVAKISLRNPSKISWNEIL